MSEFYIDLLREIPKYVPFVYKMKDKRNIQEPYTSEPCILNEHGKVLSLFDLSDDGLIMSSHQTMTIEFKKDFIEYEHMKPLIEKSDILKTLSNVKILHSGIFVFFTGIRHGDSIECKDKQTVQVIKKLGTKFYNYHTERKEWVYININTNILSIILTDIQHKCIMLEELWEF
jgi:hypothetical protein